MGQEEVKWLPASYVSQGNHCLKSRPAFFPHEKNWCGAGAGKNVQCRNGDGAVIGKEKRRADKKIS
jgi:hypothetical protein